MAAKSKTKTKTEEMKQAEAAQVVDSTLEREDAEKETGEEMIAIACALPFGLKFTDVPTGNGSTKTVTFPGLNSALKGKKGGILALPGNALCVTIPKRDWDAIVKMHGKEIAFTGRNGRMPCLYPVGDKKGFKSAASEIAEMRTGLEPVDPNATGVQEASKKE